MFGECHAHLFMNGSDYKKAVRDHEGCPDESLIRRELEEYRNRGITFIRDGGDRAGVGLLASKIAPEYGICLFTPVFAIHKEGHYGGIVGRSFRTPEEFRRLAEEVRKAGGDFIKIMTTGIMDFRTPDGLTGEPLSYEEVRGMTETAHDLGMKVMAHTNGPQAVLDAVQAGVDSIEHGNFQNEESLTALAESSAVWVPTVVTVRNLIGDGRFDDRVLQRIWEGQQRNIRFYRKKHGTVALGSDAGAYRVPHGQGLVDEYQAFQDIFPGDSTLDADLRYGEALIHTFKRGEN
ncbi:MAG: amidohydrolase family protein [Eubacteriales bacterium]|nr:amidohydrolase family protein [Eubacteriales bacterium]